MAHNKLTRLSVRWSVLSILTLLDLCTTTGLNYLFKKIFVLLYSWNNSNGWYLHDCLNIERPNKRMRWKWNNWPPVVQQHYIDCLCRYLFYNRCLIQTFPRRTGPRWGFCILFCLMYTPCCKTWLVCYLLDRQSNVYSTGLILLDIQIPLGYLYIHPNPWW